MFQTLVNKRYVGQVIHFYKMKKYQTQRKRKTKNATKEQRLISKLQYQHGSKALITSRCHLPFFIFNFQDQKRKRIKYIKTIAKKKTTEGKNKVRSSQISTRKTSQCLKVNLWKIIGQYLFCKCWKLITAQHHGSRVRKAKRKFKRRCFRQIQPYCGTFNVAWNPPFITIYSNRLSIVQKKPTG